MFYDEKEGSFYRRWAGRHGLKLEVSRTQDETAPDFQLGRLVDAETGRSVFGSDDLEYSASLEEIHQYLVSLDESKEERLRQEREMPITIQDLIKRLEIFDPESELCFGDGSLTFYRVKKRGKKLIQIEFNEVV